MDEIDYHYTIRHQMYSMGMIETMCFMLTNEKEWWYIDDDNTLVYTMYDEDGRSSVIMEFFGNE